MVEVRNVDVMTEISAIAGGTIDVIKNVEAMSGTVDINGLVVSGGTMQVNTELALSADNVTIGNVKTFADSSGTQDFGLIDSSRRVVLAPSSTIYTFTHCYDYSSTLWAAIGLRDAGIYGKNLQVQLMKGDDKIQDYLLSDDNVITSQYGLLTGAVMLGYNWSDDRFNWIRTVQSVNGGTILKGLLATGLFGYDGANYRPVKTDTTGNLTLSITSTVPVSFATSSTVQVVQPVASSGTTLAVTVTTSTVQVLASNASRKSFAVTGNAVWYLGFGTGLTASNGFKLAADQPYVDGGVGVYTGEVWGITASGTADVRAVETS